MADGETIGGGLVPEQLIGERIAERFIVDRVIGHGELSTAFRAHDERLHRRVTVKLFHPRHRDDVQVVTSQLAAARSVARLSHEHIAMVIDRGEHEGMPLIVLEHVRGENLQERIDRFAPLAVGEVVGYALQLGRALAYAHGHGVMHGNLRPGNVLLTEERDVKLVDFGGGSYVAQLIGDPFAAPELREVDPDAPIEPSDDIYALGVLIHVALTEQAPHPGLEPAELQLARPDVSPRLAAVVARAVAADPADRFLSMREFASELAGVREASSDLAVTDFTAAAGQATAAFSMPDVEDEDTIDERTAVVRAARPVRKRPERRVRSPRETRARILAWSMVAAPLVALVIFGVMIAGERSEQGVDGPAKAATGALGEIEVTGAVSFDPPPDGDGQEHADEIANLFDGDLETTWETEGYDTSTFNDAKPGVGVMLQLAQAADVQDVVFDTKLPGWVVEVRVADQPSKTLDGWTAVSKPTPVESGVRIPVRMDGDPTRHVLLWITKLAIDTEDPDRSRARFSEVTVFGAPRK